MYQTVPWHGCLNPDKIESKKNILLHSTAFFVKILHSRHFGWSTKNFLTIAQSLGSCLFIVWLDWSWKYCFHKYGVFLFICNIFLKIIAYSSWGSKIYVLRNFQEYNLFGITVLLLLFKHRINKQSVSSSLEEALRS